MESKLREISNVVKALVITHRMEKITVAELQHEYMLTEGCEIPYHTFGHKDVIAFLNHLPDVNVLGEGPSAEVKVSRTEKSAHIVELMRSVRNRCLGPKGINEGNE